MPGRQPATAGHIGHVDIRTARVTLLDDPGRDVGADGADLVQPEPYLRAAEAPGVRRFAGPGPPPDLRCRLEDGFDTGLVDVGSQDGDAVAAGVVGQRLR